MARGRAEVTEPMGVDVAVDSGEPDIWAAPLLSGVMAALSAGFLRSAMAKDRASEGSRKICFAS